MVCLYGTIMFVVVDSEAAKLAMVAWRNCAIHEMRREEMTYVFCASFQRIWNFRFRETNMYDICILQ